MFLTCDAITIGSHKVIRNFSWLILMALALPAIGQTSPVNDNTNSRINLGSVASYTTSTSNLGASTQNQENTVNGLLGATLWWQWTCPSAGWCRIDTRGSDIDTVLKINTGSNASSAMLGYNDDEASDQITSSLSFIATAGTTYYLQIGGYQGEEGNIQLNITTGAGATPSHWPSAVSFSPTSVTTSTGDAVVTTEIAITGTSGITGSVDLQFLRPNETVVSPTLSGSLAYSSGTLPASVSYTIPRYSAAGNWNPLVTLQPETGSALRFGNGNSGRPYLLNSSILPSLSVANSGTSDVLAPVLQSFSISTTEADVNQGPATISLSAVISDDVSGVLQAAIWLYHPTDPALHLMLPVALTAGNSVNGTWSGQATIPREYPSEIYSVNIMVSDKALNQAVYGAYSNLQTPGGDVFFTIHGGGAYWQWAYRHIKPSSALVHLTDDANGDGINNLLCYAFGINPLSSPLAGSTPTATLTQDSPAQLTIHYRRNATPDSGLSYFPEFSENLSTWEASSNEPTMISETGNWQEWQAIDHETTSNTPRRFGRVRVIYLDTSS